MRTAASKGRRHFRPTQDPPADSAGDLAHVNEQITWRPIKWQILFVPILWEGKLLVACVSRLLSVELDRATRHFEISVRITVHLVFAIITARKFEHLEEAILISANNGICVISVELRRINFVDS